MGDNNGPPTVEDLMRQLEAMRLRNEAVEAARITAERGREQAEAAAEELRTQGPQNAQQYMHPTLRVPDSAIVLPELGPRGFEIKPHFITLIKTTCFEGRPTEDPIRHVKVFLDLC